MNIAKDYISPECPLEFWFYYSTNEVFLSSAAGILWALRYWRRLVFQNAPNIHRQHLLCSEEERKILKIIRYQFQTLPRHYFINRNYKDFLQTNNPPPHLLAIYCYAIRDCILSVVNHNYLLLSSTNQIIKTLLLWIGIQL